jgi:hypothetical protein
METLLLPNTPATRLISVSRETPVLVLDDSIGRRNWFLSKHRVPRSFVAATNESAIRIVNSFKPEFIFLDFDLGLGVSSEPFAKHLREISFTGDIVIHSDNPFGREVLSRILPAAKILPFGSFEIVQSPFE